MVSKSHVWPDARSHGGTAKDTAVGTGSVGAVGTSANELPVPVAKGANGQVPSTDAAVAPAKPEGTGKNTTTDDKVRTVTFPPAHLEPRKWRAWKGSSAPGETPEDDVDLAENDVGGPPLDEEAHARDLEVGWYYSHACRLGCHCVVVYLCLTHIQVQGASLNAEHGKAKPSDTHSHSGTSAHTQGSKDETKHKASFMEKVKGEMKIISGKLGGDKAKVEEGKKLKSGQV